jgi:hypothetical protein
MKGNVLLWVSAAMYWGIALFVSLSLLFWKDYASRPLSPSVIVTVAFIVSMCAFFGFAALKARKGSLHWIKAFAISGGMFAGLAAWGNWKVGIVFAVPLAVALFALWRSGVLANRAFESGRAEERRAAQRER